MQFLRESTGVTVMIGPFLDDTDGKTAETGLTIAQANVRLSKVDEANGNAQAFAQTANAAAATHAENGYYTKVLDAADVDNKGRLILAVQVAGALPVWHEYTVVEANVFDSLIAGSDNLDVELATSATGSITATTFAAGAVNAAAIATNAIDADALAADVATEIAAATVTVANANKIADHILRRSFATAAGSADGDVKSFRSLLGAVAKLVNKVAIVANTLSVFEADDTTALGTQAVTTDPHADAIISVDTA